MEPINKNAPVRRRDCAFGEKDLTAYRDSSMLQGRANNMERIVLFAGLMSTSTTIHPMNVPRPVGPGSNRAVSLCSRPPKQVSTIRPLEGGTNSVNGDLSYSGGAVLPAVVNWLLITGWCWTKQIACKGVTNSPLNDNYGRNK